MRLKPTDASFSVSEIHFESPEPSDRGKALRPDESLQNILEHQEPTPPKTEQPPVAESESHSHQSQPPLKKALSYKSPEGGRVGFKGTLKQVYKTKKDNYIQDGNEMLTTQKELKTQEDKVITDIVIFSPDCALAKQDLQPPQTRGKEQEENRRSQEPIDASRNLKQVLVRGTSTMMVIIPRSSSRGWSCGKRRRKRSSSKKKR